MQARPLRAALAAFAALLAGAALGFPARAAETSGAGQAVGTAAERAAHHARTVADAQYVFTAGVVGQNPVIYVYAVGGNPNVPVATLTQDLGTSVSLGGVDASGNLYVTAFFSGASHIVIFPPPYGSTDVVGPAGESVGAITNSGVGNASGTLAGTGPLGSAVYPPNSFTPSLQWPGISAVYLNAQAFDLAGNRFSTAFSFDELWDGIVRYPPGSTQGVDQGLPFPATNGVLGIAFDASGNLLVSQQAGNPTPPTLKVFAPAAKPDHWHLKRTIKLSFSAFEIAFDASFSHLFLSSNVGGVYEYTYPAFKLLAKFGASPPTGGNGVVVFPPSPV